MVMALGAIEASSSETLASGSMNPATGLFVLLFMALLGIAWLPGAIRGG
ncbi:MAG: hypothetical protein LBL59_06025 [Xanthomonadaceae bacterium]|jgi:hypothetical protein|nr:hypothetical protein [Xanthomonadaceae bacterium]